MSERGRCRALVLGVSFALASILGCANGSELTVDVRTDYVAMEEFAAVRTELSTSAFTTGAVTGTPVDLAASPLARFLSGARVAEYANLAPGTYWVRVSLLSSAGTVIASRVTTLALAQNNFSITTILSRSCGTTSCPPAGSPSLTACNGGTCVDPRCTPESPELCGAGECVRDADCRGGPTGACVRAVCEGGACLYGGDDSLCGAGQHCTAALACVADAQPNCGGTNEPCCSGACGPGATCASGNLCVACGDTGQPCCGSTCNAGNLCDTAHGVCNACGGRDQPCCASDACRDMALCSDTASGRRCECGGRGQICCGWSSCDPGILCQGTGFGPLCLCGTRDRPCCPGRLCDDGSTCLDTGFGPLCLCGTRDRPCCPGRSCDDGSTCLDTGFGPLCLCGTSGRPCCAGRVCDDGSTCHDTGFGPICQ